MFRPKNLIKLSSLTLFLIALTTAEVSVNFDNYDVTVKDMMYPQLKNTTATSWIVGGWRFYTNIYEWDNAWGPPRTITNTNIGNSIEHELLLTDPSQSMLQPGGGSVGLSTFAYAAPQWTETPEKPFGTHIFLKTGAIGKPDDPIDENPITIDQIDSLISLPSFYNAGYRYTYIDSLGTNGGQYSGGFMGTFLGETQAIVAIPTDTFHINNDVLFDPDVMGGPIYMMTIAMMQEYFNVDMQWMLMTGAKETNAALKGVNGITVPYVAHNPAAGYGPFEVETPTGVSRAIAYPKFFPEYSDSLAKYSWDQTSFIGAYGETFMSDYCHPTFTGANSAYLVGSSVLSGLCYYFVYDACAYSTDICWLETLSGAIDPHLGLAAMMQGYNVGINSGFEGPLKNPAYEDLLDDPNASASFSAFNNYFADAINMLSALFKASDESRTDASIVVWDENITLDDLKTFFFGDGGTVTTQGGGGLFKHFTLNRQQVWSKIEAAFNKLKGNAPTTTGTQEISFRHDFLTLLRVVKGDMNFKRGRVVGSEAIDWIKKNSTTGGCSELEEDKKYPYGDAGVPEYNSEFIVDIICKDNIGIKEVIYTLDSAWSNWSSAIYKSGTGGNQTFTITIPKDEITSIYGEGTGTLWFMVTDESGNSIVKPLLIKGSPLKSSAAIDLSGDGKADVIHVHIAEKALDTDSGDVINTPDQFNYNWPNPSPLSPVTGATYTTGLFKFAPSNNDGAGLGKVEIFYPTMEQAANKDIVDSIGPAISLGSPIYKIPENNTELDTLILQFSENIKSISGGELFLAFKSAGTTDSVAISANSVSGLNSDWTFIFDYHEIINYDSVKIVSSSSLVDMVDNSPANYNQWVVISKQGNNDPEWDISYIHDLNGNGDGDEITIKISKGNGIDAFTMSDLSEITYTWPNGEYATTITAIPTPINDETIILNPPNEVSASGVGDITLSFIKGSDSYNILNKAINDSVGPVIDSALYNIKNIGDTSEDTLQLTISEPLNSTLTINTEYINLKTITGVITKTEVLNAVNTTGNSWIFILTSGAVGENDSVNLVPNTNLIDFSQNSPQTNNQYAHIKKTGGKIPVVDNAFIEDSNGNGIGDIITVSIIKGKSNSAFTLDSCDSLKFRWPNANPIKTIYPSFTGLTGTITSDIDAASTGVGSIILYFSDNAVVEVVGSIADSIGPVINSAIYHEKNIGDTSEDTLQLVLSEPLKGTLTGNTEYINLKTDAGVITKTEVLSTINTSDNNWLFILSPGAIGDNDSVNFIEGTNLVDNYDNSPQANNQFVFISKLGGKIPILNNAYIKDSNGNGIGDIISVSITKGNSDEAFTLNNCDSLKFNWPDYNTTKTITSGLTGISSTITSDIDSAGHGTGKLNLFFYDNNLIEISGDITDSIGPAISSAYYKEMINEPCSLQIIFTEPITNNLLNNTAYLNINNVPIISSTVIPVNNDGLSWIFVLPVGSISKGDSVNLISNSGLIDQAFTNDSSNNKPHPENVKVEIVFESSIYTIKTEKSAYYDANADGIMDSLSLFLSKPINDSILSLLKFIIEWPDESGNNTLIKVNGNNFQISGQNISLKIQGIDLQKDLTIIDSTYGGVILIQPIDDSLGAVDTSGKYLNLLDKMAPVITSASFYEYKSNDIKDELIVTFSEEITAPVLNSTPFVFNKNEYIMALNPQVDFTAWTDTLILSFTKVNGGNPKAGDSLNINADASITGSAVQANAMNKHVKLNVFTATVIKEVSYHDEINHQGAEISDGYIDLIKVKTDSTIFPEMYDSLAKYIVLNPNRQFKLLQSSHFSSLSSGENGFEINVTQATGTLKNTATSEIDDILSLASMAKTTSGFILNPQITIQDSLAPVIITASISPVEITEENFEKLLKDTLIIEYSEDINFDSMNSNPLIFKSTNNTSINVDLAKNTLINSKVVQYLIDYNSDKAKDGDSVQIATTGNIQGLGGSNIQTKENIFVRLSVKEVPFHWQHGVFPNPLILGNDLEIEKNKSILSKYLKISESNFDGNIQAIVVDPLGPVPPNSNITMTIKIFDALGHLLIEDEFNSSNDIWYYLWNAKNNNDRDVGSGVYIGYIKVTPESMNSIEEPIKLGIGN